MKHSVWILCVTMVLLGMAYGQTNPFVVGTGIAKTTQGTSYTNAPFYEASYFAFNGQRTSGGWTFDSDTASNGGAIMTGDVGGGIRFLVVPISPNGASPLSITDSQIGQYTRMFVGRKVEIVNANDTGLVVTTTHLNPYGYGILSYVSQPYTKALAVQYDNGGGTCSLAGSAQ